MMNNLCKNKLNLHVEAPSTCVIDNAWYNSPNTFSVWCRQGQVMGQFLADNYVD